MRPLSLWFYMFTGTASLMMTSPAMSAEPAAFEYRGGAFGELTRMPRPEHVGVLFVPSLFTQVFQAERNKGAALTKQEFAAIRDMAPAMMMDKADIQAIEQERGGTPNDFSYEDYLDFREER